MLGWRRDCRDGGGEVAVISVIPCYLQREHSTHAEELVMPGTREEMDQFEHHTVSRSRCAVTCTIPSLRVHLPSKEFMEILFNR